MSSMIIKIEVTLQSEEACENSHVTEHNDTLYYRVRQFRIRFIYSTPAMLQVHKFAGDAVLEETNMVLAFKNLPLSCSWIFVYKDRFQF